MAERSIGVALLGCGVVGGSLAGLIETRGDDILTRTGIRFEIGPRATAATVNGEADRLCQVLINLISNAIKYNDADNPVVQIRSSAGKRYHTIEIADNGPGIAPRDRRRVFDKFWRGDPLGRDGSPAGVGLGLAISRQIVARMDGTLELTPTRRGACFRLKLPLTLQQAEQA